MKKLARRTQKDIIESLIVKPGLRSRIDAACVSCGYDEFAKGSWRKQAEECVVPSCPLFDVRPRSTARRSNTDPLIVEDSVSPINQENTLKGALIRVKTDSQDTVGSSSP